MKPLSISFIIPYYKVELALLARAIRSVQALGNTVDWEIWVIDDGTPESEAKHFIEQLNEPNIGYYAQTHSGPGGARNTGLDLANKEYVHFLDADDYLFHTPLKQALNMLATFPVELFAFQSQKVHDTSISDGSLPPPRLIFQGTGTDFMLRHNLHGSVWSYFFKHELARDLRFTPIAYHEDEEFTALLFLKAKQITVTNLPVYAYYQRKGSIMHRTESPFVKQRFLDLITIILNLKKKGKQLSGLPAAALNKRIDMLCMSMAYTLLGDSPDTSFLLDMRNRMKSAGLYPLSPHYYSLTYAIIRICTSTTAGLVALNKLFRLLHFKHAGKAF